MRIIQKAISSSWTKFTANFKKNGNPISLQKGPLLVWFANQVIGPLISGIALIIVIYLGRVRQ